MRSRRGGFLKPRVRPRTDGRGRAAYPGSPRSAGAGWEPKHPRAPRSRPSCTWSAPRALRVSRTNRWLKRPKDSALAAPAIVGLLFSPWGWTCAHLPRRQVSARPARSPPLLLLLLLLLLPHPLPPPL